MRRWPTALLVIGGIAFVSACSSHRAAGLPVASEKEFVDLGVIASTASQLAADDGDPHPAGVAIVKSTKAAVYGSENAEATQTDEMYFVRIDGAFTRCAPCSYPRPNMTFPATRWLSFDWDPRTHSIVDMGYGSAPHLEEFGQVYAIKLG